MGPVLVIAVGVALVMYVKEELLAVVVTEKVVAASKLVAAFDAGNVVSAA
jgi:hypothetical protein